MATPNVLATGATSYGDFGPAPSTDGVMGREFSEYGNLILRTYERENIYQNLITNDVTQVIPGNAGVEIAQWWRYPLLPNAVTLTEGQPPNATPRTRTRVTKRLTQKGMWIQTTDLERGRTSHPLSSIDVDNLMRSFMRTNDDEARNSLYLTGTPSSGNFPTSAQGGNIATSHDFGNSITNPHYGGSASSYSTLTTDGGGANFTLDKLKEMSDSMENLGVPMILPRITVNQNVAGLPGDEAYIGVTDSVGKGIIEGLRTGTGALADWVYEPIKNYSNPNAVMPNEFGRTGHIRWLWSSGSVDQPSPAWAGTGTTKGVGRRLAILGRDAFGMMTISNEMLQFEQAMMADSSDPLNQVSSTGIKWSNAFTMIRPDHVRQLFYATAA